MKRCPNCNVVVSDKDNWCRNCRINLNQNKKIKPLNTKNIHLHIIFWSLFVLIVYIIINI
jgi:hypothetical protein